MYGNDVSKCEVEEEKIKALAIARQRIDAKHLQLCYGVAIY